MRNNLPNITSIRFFLALLVVLFHTMQFAENRGFPSNTSWPIFNKGTEAVYAFFSLSGFLIIRNLFIEKSKFGTISLKSFYKRRVLRIFPLYYLVLAIGLIYYNLILPEFGFSMPRQYSVLEALFLGGTFFSNILRTYEPGGIIEVLWSIGIEEQFYLLIAPCFLLFPKKYIIWFLLAFSIIYFLLFNFSIIQFLRDYAMFFYYFSVSGLFAIFSVKYPAYRIPQFFCILIYCTIALYFFSNLFIDHSLDWQYQLLSVLLFPFFIISLIQQPSYILDNQLLKYFGKISYGIYMLHSVVLQLVGFITLKVVKIDAISPILFIIGFCMTNIILTLVLSHWSYQYFEKYFIKLDKKKEN